MIFLRGSVGIEKRLPMANAPRLIFPNWPVVYKYFRQWNQKPSEPVVRRLLDDE